MQALPLYSLGLCRIFLCPLVNPPCIDGETILDCQSSPYVFSPSVMPQSPLEHCCSPSRAPTVVRRPEPPLVFRLPLTPQCPLKQACQIASESSLADVPSQLSWPLVPSSCFLPRRKLGHLPGVALGDIFSDISCSPVFLQVGHQVWAPDQILFK